MDYNMSADAAHPGRQLAVLSFQVRGTAYYLAVIEGGPRDAISFRGYTAALTPTGIRREVLAFHLQGPLIEDISNLEDLVDILGIDVKGTLGTASGTPNNYAGKVTIAPAPQLSADGKSPHGVLLWVEGHQNTVVTVADLQEGLGWIVALVIIAVVVVVVVETPEIIAALKGGSGASSVTVTTPVGTVSAVSSFNAASGTAPATSTTTPQKP